MEIQLLRAFEIEIKECTYTVVERKLQNVFLRQYAMRPESALSVIFWLYFAYFYLFRRHCQSTQADLVRHRIGAI
jgi:hypothetical protein